MADENSIPIKGVLFEKRFRTEKGKKDPTKTYDYKSIILEVVSTKEETNYKGGKMYVTKPILHKFDLSPWMSFDEFAEKDFIEVRYILDSFEYINKNGDKDIITKPKAIHIKHADIDSGKRPASKDKVAVTAMSNIDDLKIKEVFVPPDPDDDTWKDDLPF